MNPVDELATETGVPTARPPPSSSNLPSILMVDDHPARLITYEAILSGMPVRCVRANSGEEALQRLLKESFALILLDVNMPGIDGFEVARHVRAHHRLGNMPIIFVSGERLSDLDRLKGYEVGAIDYIGVPIVPEILRSKVAVLIELFNRRIELERLNQATLQARAARQPEEADGATVEHLRALFEYTPDVKVILRGERDANGNLAAWRYVDANESALQLFGLERVQVIGHTVDEVFPHWAERTSMLCRQVVSGSECLQHEVEFAGRQLLVRMFAVDADCVAVTCTDITERKRIEAALASSDRRKDEFLAMLAHELRNPVAPILSVAQLLAAKCGSDDALAPHVAIVERQARNLARLLDDLLDVARITRDRIELRRERVELSQLVDHALETVDPILRAGGYRLARMTECRDCWVHVDAVRITQCLSNILNNAAKYSPPDSAIVVRTFASDDRAFVEVQDRGRGIAAEILPHIFELFAQAPQPLNREMGGLGIGLSVCKRLIEMHEGSITAESEGPGFGSTFRISLPRETGDTPSESTSAAAATTRRRVLVVDDNRDAADSISLLLQMSGHDVRVLYRGEDALALCRSDPPDVLVLDIGLPGMDGYEVIRRLRTDGFASRAIALSGYGRPEDRERSAVAGFDAHLVKPVELEALEAALVPGQVS